jgi:hypothetical protein
VRRLGLICALALALAGQTGYDHAQEQEFVGRFNRFVEEANHWARSYNQGLFDFQRAKRLSKLWREVEASGTWPGEK